MRQKAAFGFRCHITTIRHSFSRRAAIHTVSKSQLDYSSLARTPATAARSSRKALHLVATLTACATFSLIFMGGLVTSHQAGMSVPDWPNSYGYNMFLFPPTDWVGGIFYEHTHRLMGSIVGFLAVVLVLVAYKPGENRARRRMLGWGSIFLAIATVILALLRRPVFQQMAVGCGGIALCSLIAYCRSREPRRWVRWLTVCVLGAVILQGILGGLRVVLVKLDLAIVHACVAQAFFCLTALAAGRHHILVYNRHPRQPFIRFMGVA